MILSHSKRNTVALGETSPRAARVSMTGKRSLTKTKKEENKETKIH